jgi:hypothetical protein
MDCRVKPGNDAEGLRAQKAVHAALSHEFVGTERYLTNSSV